MNELAWVLRRERKLARERIADITDAVGALCQVASLSRESHQRALGLVRAHSLSWWDALQLAVALENDAAEILSEDLHHGPVFERRLHMCNPFLSA